jgi:hypothetical protein
MGVVVHSRGMLPGIGMVATICVAACSASPAPSGAVPRNHETTRPAATAAVNPTPSAAASATPAAQPGVQNLVIPSAEKSELTATFAGYEATSPSGVLGGGPLPGSVYYAYDPTTGTYWALADFELTGGMTIPIPMMFRKTGTGPWLYQRANFSPDGTQQVVPACSEIQWFPPAVLMAWSMPTAPPAGVTC